MTPYTEGVDPRIASVEFKHLGGGRVDDDDFEKTALRRQKSERLR